LKVSLIKALLNLVECKDSAKQIILMTSKTRQALHNMNIFQKCMQKQMQLISFLN